MELPFTIDQFLSVFEQYNTAIWPTQILAYLLGVACLVLAVQRSAMCDRILSAILALFWVWIGTVYHMVYFSQINPAAWAFGALFIGQAIVFLLVGVLRHDISYRFSLNAYGVVGILLFLYAMLVYPLVSAALGHRYPETPMFGVAPCPATIFTLGLLLWARNGRLPLYVVAIPFIWSVFGFFASLKLGIKEDTGLFIAGLITVIMVGWPRSGPQEAMVEETPPPSPEPEASP
jgi:hypothetical protein